MVSLRRNTTVLTIIKGKFGNGTFGDHGVRNEQDFMEKLDYIHKNPVRAGLVEKPEDYPWSSAGWYAGKQYKSFSIDPIAF